VEKEFRDNISLFIDDRLEQDELNSFILHKNECEKCGGLLLKFQETEKLLTEISVVKKNAPIIKPDNLSKTSQINHNKLVPFNLRLSLAGAFIILIMVLLKIIIFNQNVSDNKYSFVPKPIFSPVITKPETTQEVTLGDSTIYYSVEGEGTELIYMSIDAGPGKYIEIDYSHKK
jgi:hypothetical protein